jgi:hypothetical protein
MTYMKSSNNENDTARTVNNVVLLRMLQVQHV